MAAAPPVDPLVTRYGYIPHNEKSRSDYVTDIIANKSTSIIKSNGYNYTLVRDGDKGYRGMIVWQGDKPQARDIRSFEFRQENRHLSNSIIVDKVAKNTILLLAKQQDIFTDATKLELDFSKQSVKKFTEGKNFGVKVQLNAEITAQWKKEVPTRSNLIKDADIDQANGNGHCLYHAVLLANRRAQNNGSLGWLEKRRLNSASKGSEMWDLRNRVANQLTDHPFENMAVAAQIYVAESAAKRNATEEYIQADENQNPDEAVRLFIRDVREGHKWGDEAEVRALAEVLRVNIHVVSTTTGNRMESPEYVAGRPDIFVAYNGGHYDAYHPSEEEQARLLAGVVPPRRPVPAAAPIHGASDRPVEVNEDANDADADDVDALLHATRGDRSNPFRFQG